MVGLRLTEKAASIATAQSRRKSMQEGIHSCISRYAVDETVDRLVSLLHEREVKVFCTIDHAGEAAAAGMLMPPTKVVIFGSPKAGTPLMQAAPSLALDLPLKLLIAEQPDGTVRISWNDPKWLEQRHSLPEGMATAIAGIEVLARTIAG
jgi:uncharacterized protein (DUF302 family)